jgi:hypothetical protein
MEWIIQRVSGLALLSSLDGLSRYNQVLVVKEDQLKPPFKPNGVPMLMQKCLLVSSMLEKPSNEPWIFPLEVSLSGLWWFTWMISLYIPRIGMMAFHT